MTLKILVKVLHARGDTVGAKTVISISTEAEMVENRKRVAHAWQDAGYEDSVAQYGWRSMIGGVV